MKPGRYIWLDPDCGLEAVLCIHSLALGPAVGGIRTRDYPSLNDAIADAAMLARSMTIKCALAGLDAGGCKIVVRTNGQRDRKRSFERLGKFLAELGDNVHTGADFGTTNDDIRAVGTTFDHAHEADASLLDAAGRAVLRCIEACARRRDKEVSSLHVAIQGAGSMGGAVARALAAEGLRLTIVDTDEERASALAAELGASTGSADGFFALDVDVLSPCAIGGVIDDAVAKSVRAWAVCGAANNIFTTRFAERELVDNGILAVPDVISSAGAVTRGIASSLMGVADPTSMVDRLGDVAEKVLEEADISSATPEQVAIAMAEARIQAAS